MCIGWQWLLKVCGVYRKQKYRVSTKLAEKLERVCKSFRPQMMWYWTNTSEGFSLPCVMRICNDGFQMLGFCGVCFAQDGCVQQLHMSLIKVRLATKVNARYSRIAFVSLWLTWAAVGCNFVVHDTKRTDKFCSFTFFNILHSEPEWWWKAQLSLFRKRFPPMGSSLVAKLNPFHVTSGLFTCLTFQHIIVKEFPLRIEK